MNEDLIQAKSLVGNNKWKKKKGKRKKEIKDIMVKKNLLRDTGF